MFILVINRVEKRPKENTHSKMCSSCLLVVVNDQQRKAFCSCGNALGRKNPKNKQYMNLNSGYKYMLLFLGLNFVRNQIHSKIFFSSCLLLFCFSVFASFGKSYHHYTVKKTPIPIHKGKVK